MAPSRPEQLSVYNAGLPKKINWFVPCWFLGVLTEWLGDQAFCKTKCWAFTDDWFVHMAHLYTQLSFFTQPCAVRPQDITRSPRWNKDIKELKMLGSNSLGILGQDSAPYGRPELWSLRSSGERRLPLGPLLDGRGSKRSEAEWSLEPAKSQMSQRYPKIPAVFCDSSWCQVDKKDIKLFCTYCSFRQLSKPSICLPEVT